MLVFIGKSDYFRLNTGAITRTDAAYLTIVEWRIWQSCTQNVMHLAVGIDNPARALSQHTFHRGKIGEAMEIVFAILHGSFREVDSSGIEAHRGTGFHAVGGKSEGFQLLGDAVCCWFRNTAAAYLHAPYVHQSVKESACGKHHSLGFERHAHCRDYTGYSTIFNHKTCGAVLPHIEVWSVLNHFSPLLHKAHTVGLRTRTPHGRALGAIEHAELNRSTVGDNTHLSAHSVDFTHNLPLGNATHGRIAAHLCNLVHIHGYEQRSRAQSGGGTGSLTTGVAGTNHYHIIVESHNLLF